MSRHAFRPNTSPWGSVYSGIGRDENYGWWWTAGSKERRAGRKEKRVEKLVEKGKGEGSRAERLAKRSADLRKKAAEKRAKKKLKSGDALGPGILSSLPGGQPTPLVQNGFDVASEEDFEYALNGNGKSGTNPLLILAGLGVVGAVIYGIYKTRS